MPDIAAIVTKLPPDFYRPRPVEIRQVHEGDIRIEYRFQEANMESRTGHFWGGVKAYYGPTVLECDELWVDYGKEQGRAVGKVIVNDPDGTIQGDKLEFDWHQQTGSVEQATIVIDEVTIYARRVEVAPGRWTAYDFKATASKAKTPDVLFEADKFVLTPGKGGTAKRLSAVVLGQRFGRLPTYGFSLGPKPPGIGLPVPGYRPGSFMLSWGGSAKISERASFSAKTRLYQDRPAQLQATTTYSLLAKESGGPSTPSPDTGERFGAGWFDSSVVRNPDDELKQLSQKSSVVALGSAYGIRTRGRLKDAERLSKPLEITYEATGFVGGLGVLFQTRLQRVDPGGSFNSVNRNVTTLALRSREIPLAKGLSLVLGLDGSVLTSSNQAFAWGRGMGYFILRPSDRIRLGLGGVVGLEAGRAHYVFDRNYTDRALHVRGDIDLGNIDLIVLFKYDARREKWYDTELAASFVAGSFEPFIRYRQFPQQLTFGASIRMDGFLEVLRRRSLRPRH